MLRYALQIGNNKNGVKIGLPKGGAGKKIHHTADSKRFP